MKYKHNVVCPSGLLFSTDIAFDTFTSVTDITKQENTCSLSNGVSTDVFTIGLKHNFTNTI